jgi:hypothetical protein
MWQRQFEKSNIRRAPLVGQFPSQRQVSGIPIDADRSPGVLRDGQREFAVPATKIEHDIIRPDDFVNGGQEEVLPVALGDLGHPGMREPALGDAWVRRC